MDSAVQEINQGISKMNEINEVEGDGDDWGDLGTKSKTESHHTASRLSIR